MLWAVIFMFQSIWWQFPLLEFLILYIFSILISYNPVARAEIVSKGTNLTCPSIDRPVSARSSLWSIWSTFIGVGELTRGISAGFSLRTPGELKTAISDSGKKTDTDDITKKKWSVTANPWKMEWLTEKRTRRIHQGRLYQGILFAIIHQSELGVGRSVLIIY